MLLEKILGHVSGRTTPILTRFRNDVNNVEALMSLGETVELLLEKNIFLGIVGEDERELTVVKETRCETSGQRPYKGKGTKKVEEKVDTRQGQKLE